ncbi:MAG: hypothetical protein FWD62_12585 [Betaproteobacteria bacterium]|nr:hypothetical protein [Betaproteobacteria bacterium]
MSIDIQKFTADELTIERLDTLARNHEAFQVVAVSNVGAVVEKIEGRLEKQGLKCRVYTEYRSGSLVATCFGPTAPVGWAVAIGIGVHNLATFNPDYEIGKNKLAGTITVKYMKK